MTDYAPLLQALAATLQGAALVSLCLLVAVVVAAVLIVGALIVERAE